jgi:hypothetical protein
VSLFQRDAASAMRVRRIANSTVNAMKTHDTVAPRIATIERHEVRREGRSAHRGSSIAAAVAGAALAIALAACNAPGPSGNPVGGSVALPSVDVSAAASAGAQAALAALDQVDTAITANQSAAGLTADDVSSLKQLTSALRTSLQSGDMTAAKAPLDNLSSKVDSFAAKLNTDAGKTLKDAITALKAAIPAG